MPLEINEINVHISVSSPVRDAPSLPFPNHQPSIVSALSPEQIDLLVQRCVRDVMRQIRMKESR